MCYTITAESGGDRILKIGQHLPKLLARIEVGVFSEHSVVMISFPRGSFVTSFLLLLCFKLTVAKEMSYFSTRALMSGSTVISATDTPCLAPIYGLDCETIADVYKELCVAFNWPSSVKISEHSVVMISFPRGSLVTSFLFLLCFKLTDCSREGNVILLNSCTLAAVQSSLPQIHRA